MAAVVPEVPAVEVWEGPAVAVWEVRVLQGTQEEWAKEIPTRASIRPRESRR